MKPSIVIKGTPASTPIRAKRIFGAVPELLAVAKSDDALGLPKAKSVDPRETEAEESSGCCEDGL